jgi:hypothetical protein
MHAASGLDRAAKVKGTDRTLPEEARGSLASLTTPFWQLIASIPD